MNQNVKLYRVVKLLSDNFLSETKNYMNNMLSELWFNIFNGILGVYTAFPVPYLCFFCLPKSLGPKRNAVVTDIH